MAMKTRSWSNLVLLFLMAGLSTGCREQTESRLGGYAEDVVSALGFDILHEEHRVTFAPFDADEPTSKITSRYQVSEAPAEIIEKLSVLHHTDKAWLKYDRGQWIGEVPLKTVLKPPEEEMEYWYIYLFSKTPRNVFSGTERPPEIEYLLICPWLGEEDAYSTSYADVIGLSEDGTFLIQIHASGWGRCHAQRLGQE